jgi:hypothetical protein
LKWKGASRVEKVVVGRVVVEPESLNLWGRRDRKSAVLAVSAVVATGDAEGICERARDRMDRRQESTGAGVLLLLVFMVVLYLIVVVVVVLLSGELAFRNAPVACSRKTTWTKINGGE